MSDDANEGKATVTETVAPEAILPEIKVESKDLVRIRGQLSLDDRASIATFGDNAQRNVVAYADRILAQTQNRELGDTGRLLTDIIAKAKGLDPAAMQKKGFFGKLFGGARAEIEKFKGKFEDVASQIDAIAIQLEKRKDGLRRDIAVLDDLHEQTAASIAQLTAYIEAGEAFADEIKATRLPELKTIADEAQLTGDGLIEAQAYRDAQQALERLEKRIFYLKQARQIGIQQLPQIRIVQAGDETLVESLQASTRLTIPLWKQKMVLLLGLRRQEDALAMQKAVTDATNEMLRQTSSMMKDQAIAIEEQSQRGIVDLETLEQANRDLIDTIAGVLTTQEEGRQKRAMVEKRMDEMTQELRKALVQGRVS
ncbi:TelA-like protein [Candidatus Phycosocius bacilliformis]|uniref:TelA-like protein n=1 Tax=Candidatus Phycosocius bacilliformis TaxID=1445552 RepID=A0A2P2EED0_9PROT|nr:toxic anion resistance protein [Candidatus Phycosocius bacilliformis]GBF59417.1 TelA-like protein [Candidatus Phycosocius bacilliformis]